MIPDLYPPEGDLEEMFATHYASPVGVCVHAPEEPSADSAAVLEEAMEESEDADIAQGEHRDEFGDKL